MDKPIAWAITPQVRATDRLRNGQSLLPPPDVLVDLPALYSTERTPAPDKVVHVHYFVGPADWWIVEMNPADGLAFGYACLGDPDLAEWGYVSVEELAGLQVAQPMRFIDREGKAHTEHLTSVVERDEHWTLA